MQIPAGRMGTQPDEHRVFLGETSVIPPDLAPVFEQFLSIPIVIPFKYRLWVSLESLLDGTLLLRRLC